MNAIIFSGQGSQKAGMGRELYNYFPEKSELLQSVLGCTREDLYTDRQGDMFSDPEYVQPVLFAVSALWYDKYLEDNPLPSMCAGHSLGEYAALYCAGALSFEDGIKILKRRGELTKNVKNGKMTAITGISPNDLAEILQSNGFDTGIMANYNTPLQTVISGEVSVITGVEKLLSERHLIGVTPLNVSCAFHTSFMEDCSEEFNKLLSQITFACPRFPVVSNTYAKPYGEDVLQTLQYHMTRPVKWAESVNYILDNHLDITVAYPSGAMEGMIRKIRKGRRDI